IVQYCMIKGDYLLSPESSHSNMRKAPQQSGDELEKGCDIISKIISQPFLGVQIYIFYPAIRLNEKILAEKILFFA
ncbi:MAG: hypothetical protein LUH00_12520, partial [Lachnospiraceae bacterium]|nr:hypothetical protein [Lachnospiraceae bacterium]